MRQFNIDNMIFVNPLSCYYFQLISPVNLSYSSIFILLFQTCCKGEKYSTLHHLLQSDAPQSAIIFVGEQVSVSQPCQVYTLLISLYHLFWLGFLPSHKLKDYLCMISYTWFYNHIIEAHPQKKHGWVSCFLGFLLVPELVSLVYSWLANILIFLRLNLLWVFLIFINISVLPLLYTSSICSVLIIC